MVIMQRKKILIIANSLWNIYNFRYELVKELIKNKYQIYIIAPKSDEAHFFKKIGCNYYDIKIDRKGKNIINDVIYFFKLYKFISTIKPNLILSFTIKPNIYSSIASFFTRTPNIITITGLGSSLINENFSKRIIHFLYKFAINCSNMVFFQNSHDRKYFIKNICNKKFESKKISGSGINLNKFKYDKKFQHRKSSVIKILMISRILKDKGVYEYLYAAKKISINFKNIRFYYLGSFDYDNPSFISKSEFKKIISQSGVEFLGYKENVKNYITKADIVVLPSYREGLPRSLLEAQAIGRPIITTNAPGCIDLIVNQSNGYSCKLKNKEDLFKKIELMINIKHKERVKMGQIGRKIVENQYDQVKVIKTYLGEIKTLIVK